MLMLICSCKPKKVMTNELNNLEFYADSLLGTPYDIIVNRDSNYSLVTKEVKSRPGQIFPTVHFFIYDHRLSQVIHQQTLPQGSVRWLTPTEVLCESIPGRAGESPGKRRFIYDVITKSSKPDQKS